MCPVRRLALPQNTFEGRTCLNKVCINGRGRKEMPMVDWAKESLGQQKWIH